MTVQKILADGATLLASEQTGICAIADLAEAGSGPDWCLISQGETLHLRLGPGVTLPPGAAGAGRAGELACSLAGPLAVSLAVASGPALDAAGIVTPLGPAAAEAQAFARLPVPALDEGPEAAWDRLAVAVRRAQALARERRLVAAALAYRGRGRLVGPLAGDLLLRFGVSAWR